MRRLAAARAFGSALALLCLFMPRPAGADSAKEILEAAGVPGGVIVHLPCGDGRLTAALGAGPRVLVHGLDADPGHVQAARAHIRSVGRYGKVAVDTFDGRHLPYADNLVNLIVAEDVGNVPASELTRVLAPGGVACVKGDGGWKRTAKAWPAGLDEWTHWLHAADGNAVARDRIVGPPRQIQWSAEPTWSRHHDTVPSTTAMVSSGGRIFYLADEAPPCLDGSLPDKWFLVARDAFNGLLLWKRPVAEWGWSQWNTQWRGRFNVPPHLPKRLVAVNDRVFVTLGFNAPLAALDAATGEVLCVYEGTDGADEILFHQGTLVLSLNHEARKPSEEDKTPVEKSVCAVDAASGKMLWKQGRFAGLRAKYDASEPFGRLELAVGDDQVFLADRDAIVSLDLKTGQPRWRVPRPEFKEQLRMYSIRMSDQCVLVYQDGVVLFAQPEMEKNRSWHTLPGTLLAYRAQDGQLLWRHVYGGWAHNWQPDVFVIDGLVWVHEHQDVPFPGHDIANKENVDYAVIGLELLTGDLKRRFSTKEAFNVGHHHRCYRGRATERFLLASRRGVEFLDLATEENRLHHWARGACLYGFMPCNGLLYLPPHPCECYLAAMLKGYFALAPDDAPPDPTRKPTAEDGGTGAGRIAFDENVSAFKRGPAFPATGAARAPSSDAGAAHSDSADWPTLRHDPRRSGATTATVGPELEVAWKAAVGERLSPPVAGQGQVVVASIDEHRVVALDAGDGKTLWSFTAGGRVDTPPTLHQDLALFGSSDGWVYCVRRSDGQLAWRRRAAPRERLVGKDDQLESAWPVPGSILVQNGLAYLAAGRSSYLDGGIVLLALEPRTGEVVQRDLLHSPDPQTGKMPPGDARTIPGALGDVLVGDGASVYLREQRVFAGGGQVAPGAHVFSTAGFRDPSWFNRTQWTIGTVSGADLLVFDGQTAYGVTAYGSGGRAHAYYPGKSGCSLFADSWNRPGPRGASARRGQAAEPVPGPRWTARIPLRVTAMALAGGTLLAAGPSDLVAPQDPLAALEGRTGGELWSLSATDGTKLAACPLDSVPVFDGLAATAGRLFLSTRDGHLVCLAGPSRR